MKADGSVLQILRAALRRMPRVGSALRRWRAALWRAFFPGSIAFWERQYAGGGSSGRGSEGVLRAYKAEILNNFVSEHGVRSVIDLGCGDGRQIASLHCDEYIGLDVSTTALMQAIGLLGNREGWSFYPYDPRCFHDPQGRLRADLALSIDVIYHLVEDPIFDAYMRDLFRMGTRFVVIYSVNAEGSSPVPYTRPRRFTDWVERWAPDWRLIERLENPHAWDERTSRGSWSEFFFYSRSSPVSPGPEGTSGA